MTKQGVKKYDAGNVIWLCGLCGHTNSDQITEDAAKSEEYNQFQNYQFQCTSCNGFIFVNMNIPESEFEEFDLEIEHMDYFEINARKQIRDIIFNHRQDMKALSKQEKEAKRNAKKEAAADLRRELHARIMTEQMDKKRRDYNKKNKGRGIKS